MSASAKTVRITASYLPREYAVASVVSKTDTAMVKNNSLDSGVDGLRDSPNSGLRDSPNYIHDSPNQNYLREQVNLQHAPLKSASTSGMVKLHPMRGETVHAENIELPEYIVDQSTRTTYLKGKFLGKVCDFISDTCSISVRCMVFGYASHGARTFGAMFTRVCFDSIQRDWN